MSIQSESEIDDIDDFLSVIDHGPKKNQPPTEAFFDELTEGRYPKICNIQYWLKHELFVYNSLLEKGWFMSKPNREARSQVSIRELTRALLSYYLDMMYLAKFVSDRPERQNLLVDKEKLLDMMMGHQLIVKTVTDPTTLL